ncbi:MAG: RNHCP domain-containing protein [Phycisphaerae bacterium]
MSRDQRRRDPGVAAFTCGHCRLQVSYEVYGSKHRNHCPFCLWSVHVDETPGDRHAGCGQPMEPIGIDVRADGEWAIIHRCRGCRQMRTNRIAGDDQELALLQLALRPLASPPFPLTALPVGQRQRR